LNWTLERYAGTTDGIDEPWLNVTVDFLRAKWCAYGDAFYGYRIGHEDFPSGEGIYDQDTYPNLIQVIQTVRDRGDTTSRMLAFGNVTSTGTWTPAEQDSFRHSFFRPAAEPGPANVLFHEHYRIWPTDDTEAEVQTAFDALMSGYSRAGAMVRTALSEGRKAEWHCLVGVADEYRTGGVYQYRVPSVAELRAQINLALSRGAKGIAYFCHSSSNGMLGDGREYRGIVQYATPGTPRPARQPQWSRVRAVNDTLRVLGDSLYALRWVAGFSKQSIPAGDTIIVHAVSGDSVHLATFYKPSDQDRDYLMLVNRYRLTDTTSTQSVVVTLRPDRLRHPFRGAGVYSLTDVVSGQRQIRSTTAAGHLVLPCAALPAGAARLYRVERDSVWAGAVALTADVTLPAGTELRIAPGAQVAQAG